MIQFFLSGIFFLLSFGQLTRLSFLGQQVNVYLYEVFVLILLLILFFKQGVKPVFEVGKRFWGWLALMSIALISFVINIGGYTPSENLVAFLYIVRLSLYFKLFLYLFAYFRKKKQDKARNIGFTIFAIFTVIFSVLQYFLYPDLRNLFYQGWDPHLYRTFGVFLDTSVAAALYGLSFIYLFLKKEVLAKQKVVKYILLAALIILGLLTYSRGFYLAFIVAVITYFLRQKKYLVLAVVLGIFILSLVALPKKFGEGVNLFRTFSVSSRLTDDETAIEIWQKAPVFGIGYNRIRYEKERMGVIEQSTQDITHAGASFHSSYLIILSTLGVFGLAAFLALLWQLAMVSTASSYLILFVTVFSLFDNIFLHPFVLILTLLLVSGEKS